MADFAFIGEYSNNLNYYLKEIAATVVTPRR